MTRPPKAPSKTSTRSWLLTRLRPWLSRSLEADIAKLSQTMADAIRTDNLDKPLLQVRKTIKRHGLDEISAFLTPIIMNRAAEVASKRARVTKRPPEPAETIINQYLHLACQVLDEDPDYRPLSSLVREQILHERTPTLMAADTQDDFVFSLVFLYLCAGIELTGRHRSPAHAFRAP